MSDDQDNTNLVSFPFSKSGVSKTSSQSRNLGLTKLSFDVNPSGAGAKGHWCDVCKGIWYAYFLEVECPVCGRRG
jgi:hypothetical protein